MFKTAITVSNVTVPGNTVANQRLSGVRKTLTALQKVTWVHNIVNKLNKANTTEAGD